MDFEFELVVTERCNFKCPYCYMSNRKNNMSRHTFEAHYRVLPEIMSLYGCDRFNMSLFGGEPLMNWDLISYVVPKVRRDGKCNNIVMPTNGTLLNYEKIDFLQKHKVNISLSYDGLWQESGHTSVSAIVERMGLNACKVMIPPKRNSTLVKNYLFLMEDLDIKNPDFTLVRDDVWSPEDVDTFKVEIKELADKVIELNKQGIQTIPGIFSLYILDALAGRKYGKRPFGCFAGQCGAAFMPDGCVYPCARYGSAGKEEIADSIENIINKNRITRLRINTAGVLSECTNCELHEYCNAGCTFSQQYNCWKPIENVCRLLKACYMEAFRIVDELKDNENFTKHIKRLVGKLYEK